MSLISSYSNNSLSRYPDISKLRDEAVKLGTIANDWAFIVSLVSFNRPELDELVEQLQVIEGLIWELPERLFDGDSAQFFGSLGLGHDLSNWLAQYSDGRRLSPIRWDMIPSKKGWKVIELNIGVCLGAMNFNLLREPFAAAGLVAPVSSWPESLQLLIEHIRKQYPELRPDAHISLLEDDLVYDRYKFFLDSLTAYFKKHSGFKISAGPVSSTLYLEGKVYSGGESLDAFIGMFTVEEIFSDPIRYAGLIEGLEK